MPEMTATQCVAVSLNVSFKRLISPEELVKIFKKEADWKPWSGHLDVFFDEVPTSMIKKFMSENNLSIDQLSEICDSMPPVWKGKSFREMRDAAMGKSIQEGRQTT
ncbi:MAG: hypothetical protein LBV70_01600 [Candidatus Adiutrix sp.]|jgi:hypothetical protein|nr:hypothetical protein [Candidatus Adiutrix sp.]